MHSQLRLLPRDLSFYRRNRGSIKFNDLPALKDLARGITGVSKSILSVGTPGQKFPQYCLNLALSFWNLAQGKSHGLGRGFSYWQSQLDIQEERQFAEG